MFVLFLFFLFFSSCASSSVNLVLNRLTGFRMLFKNQSHQYKSRQMTRSKCKLHAFNKNSGVLMTSLASLTLQLVSGVGLDCACRRFCRQMCLLDHMFSKKKMFLNSWNYFLSLHAHCVGCAASPGRHCLKVALSPGSRRPASVPTHLQTLRDARRAGGRSQCTCGEAPPSSPAPWPCCEATGAPGQSDQFQPVAAFP